MLFLDHEICQVRYPKGGTSVITEMGFDAANWTKDILVLLGIGSSDSKLQNYQKKALKNLSLLRKKLQPK